MRRWSNRHQLRLITEISFTPLLNLALLVLLIFFMVVPLLRQVSPAKAAPAAKPKTAGVPEKVVNLQVGEDQSLQLDGQVIPRADLPGKLDALVKDHPEAGVMVKVPRSLPVEVLVDLMAELRRAGVQKTAVAAPER